METARLRLDHVSTFETYIAALNFFLILSFLEKCNGSKFEENAKFQF